MKKFLFDFLTLQDKNINGGNLVTKTVLLTLIEKGVELVGVCSDKDRLNPEIKKLAEEKAIKVYEWSSSEKKINEIIDKESITDFFIGISQRYNHVDLSNLKCKIFTICHDLTDLIVESAELSSRKDWFISPSDYWKKVSGNKLKRQGFIKRVKRGTIRLIKNYGSIERENKRLKLYANFQKLIKKDNVYVITVSEFSKHAIEYYFSDIANEIAVFYPPILYRENTEVSFEFKRAVGEKEYFLLLNANRPNKNANVFIKQYPKLKERFKDRFNVVMLGAGEEINDESIISFSRVSDAELEYLTANAYALIYPSVSEGFGLPPVEAMSYGTPVIAAYDTSIPEACGDGALYFNPFYVEDLYFKIIEMTENRDKYVEKAKNRFEVLGKELEISTQKLVEYILK